MSVVQQAVPCSDARGLGSLGSDAFLLCSHSRLSDRVPEDVWTGLDVKRSSEGPMLGVGF